MTDIRIPVFPESVTSGLIAAWRKRAGDAVAEGEVLADVETDKVVFEVTAPASGVLDALLVSEGGTVSSGQIIGRVLPGGDHRSVVVPPVPPTPAATPSRTSPSARRRMPDPIGRTDTPVMVSRTATARPKVTQTDVRPTRRVPMTPIRRRIADRLLMAQAETAMLTTFNEVNLQEVMELRAQYREAFEKAHGVKLGLMSFFVHACVEALKQFPEINASIEDDEVVYHDYYDIGVAIGARRGLVVPVLREADRMDLPAIERTIRDFAERAEDGRLTLEELSGGTFTITNGGVFGSLLSTPIVNPPQSAILGMHRIQDRPIAEHGEVVIRPMMYVALTYDHRLVDGRGAVQFLATVKEFLERPGRALLGV